MFEEDCLPQPLLGNNSIACATCHHPLFHTGDGLSLSVGTDGAGLGPQRTLGAGRDLIPRHAPDVFNRGLTAWITMFWDSRVSVSPTIGFISPAGDALPAGLDSLLAVQAIFPVTSRDEMREHVGNIGATSRVNELAALDDGDFPGIWDALMRRLLAIPTYVALFKAAYPQLPAEAFGFEHAANAIAAFEKQAWTFLNSPWDRYVAGDDAALSDEVKEGALLFFGEAGCAHSHAGGLFTDQRHHNIATPQIGPGKDDEVPLDFGRAHASGNTFEQFRFHTPPLRNVALNGPWMHNGAYPSLEAAVRHHLDPANALRNYDASHLSVELQVALQDDEDTLNQVLAYLDPLVATPKYLTDREVSQLVAFLHALTDPAALDLRHDIPASVPSGLPVDR